MAVEAKRVVITGVGAVTPLGVGAAMLFERWAAGESGIEDGLGRCRDFDPNEFLSRKEAHRSDRFTQFALVAAIEALRQAGIGDELPYEPERVACVVGTGIGGLTSLEQQEHAFRDQGKSAVSPLTVPLMMGNAPAAAISIRYGIRGEAYTMISGCSGGTQAIGAGLRMIEAGMADAVVAGGTEAAITPMSIAAFDNMGATSRSGISRPFDARRDGFVLGEGAGVLVLEEAGAAAARGAIALGEVLGYAGTSDAHHLTEPDPSGTEVREAMTRALADAALEPADVDYINAHGTSTPLNDRSETLAIKQALGERAGQIPVSSTKSAIGHLLGAAGAVEAIATLESLRRGLAAPTLGWEQREEGLDLDYVPGAARPLAQNGNGSGPRPLVGLSNSFGFGGHNAVLCLAANSKGGEGSRE